jgi:hypothetical protein
MIVLDFCLVDALGYLKPEQVPFVNENQIAADLFECYLTFKVDSVDLSWRAPVPMIDFARTMFTTACSLSSPDHTMKEFISLELAPWWSFQLQGSRVLISRDDVADRAECEQAELIRATGDFGVRVYDACLAALPAARENTFLSNWYPIDEMKRAANGNC